MKNYRVKPLINFNDNEENVLRIANADNNDFFVTRERYEFLKSKNAVQLVEVEEDKKDYVITPLEQTKQPKKKKYSK